jgi:hypothetical protein
MGPDNFLTIGSQPSCGGLGRGRLTRTGGGAVVSPDPRRWRTHVSLVGGEEWRDMEARVLLVEDDERIRQALGLALQMRATRSARHSLRPNPNRDTGQVGRSEP